MIALTKLFFKLGIDELTSVHDLDMVLSTLKFYVYDDRFTSFVPVRYDGLVQFTKDDICTDFHFLFSFNGRRYSVDSMFLTCGMFSDGSDYHHLYVLLRKSFYSNFPDFSLL